MHNLINAAASRVFAAKDYGNIQEEFNDIFKKAKEEFGERRFVKSLYESLRDDSVAYNYARQMVYRARHAESKNKKR